MPIFILSARGISKGDLPERTAHYLEILTASRFPEKFRHKSQDWPIACSPSLTAAQVAAAGGGPCPWLQQHAG
jgi:hypothetical protein